MNKGFITYILQLAGITLLYILLYYLMKDFLAARFYPSWWKCGIFFFILFSVIHYLRLAKSKGNESIRFFMASTAFKLFLMLTVIVSYMFLNPDTAIPFAVSFLMAYFLFMIFDVAKAYTLMKTT